MHDRARDAEVREAGLAAGEENVLRLDVAMEHVPLVRRRQRGGDRLPDRHYLRHRQLLVALEARSQRSAVEIRQHEEQAPLVRPGIQDRNDVRMMQLRRDPHLTQKALGGDVRRELFAENLERDRSAKLAIARKPNGRRRTATELSLNRIPTGEFARDDAGRHGPRPALRVGLQTLCDGPCSR